MHVRHNDVQELYKREAVKRKRESQPTSQNERRLTRATSKEGEGPDLRRATNWTERPLQPNQL